MPHLDEDTAIGKYEPFSANAGESTAPDETANGSVTPPDPAVTLQHMEKLLGQIRGSLDAATRDTAHREYSAGRTIGAILQVIVAGLVALALLDWLLDAPADALYVKLAFAAVLQLSALTAFVLSRGKP